MAEGDKDKTDRVEEAIAFYRAASAAYSKQYDREKEDLQFQDGDYCWPDEIKQTRRAQTVNGIPLPARPMLSVATLDEPIQLVENQQRGAHLGIIVHPPLHAGADDELADVAQDLYRQIETDSRAHLARNWAFDRALKCGRGAYVIRSAYDRSSDDSTDQKIVIERLLYQSAVYLDPFAVQPDWSDGERALIVEDIPWPVYKRKYKKSKLASLGDDGLTEVGAEVPDWIGGDTPENRTIRVGRYYYVEHEEDEDGNDERQVQCCVVNATEVLEEYEWGGQYIPIPPTIGKELQPWDGERRWMGMVRNARDGVRLTNYAASGAIEMAALEPKAPYTLDPKQIAGYDSWWQNVNTRNWPYLPHHEWVDGKQFSPPQRVQVDATRMGPNMQLLSMGRDFVQAATQTYDPALGKQPTAHRSGKAIVALQDQTVEATNDYMENFADITLAYEAKVILDAIPYYYDRPGRMVTLRNEQHQTRQAIINQPFTTTPTSKRPVPLPYGTDAEKKAADAFVADPNHPAKHYDLSKLRHAGVTVTIGKSYKNKLEEGSDALSQLFQAEPQTFMLLGDLWLKFQSWPGHQEAAERLAKMLPPQLQAQNGNGQPTAQDVQKLQAENQQLKQALGVTTQHIQTKQVEQQGKAQIVSIQETAETQRAREANETKIAVAELGAKVDRLALFLEERARLGVQGHEVAMGAADHHANLAEAAQAHQHELIQGQQDHVQTLEQGDQAGAQALAQGAQPPPIEPNAQQEPQQ